MPIQKRSGYRKQFDEETREIVRAHVLCPQCKQPNKRTSCTCCSTTCTRIFWKRFPLWVELCRKIKERDKTCRMCGTTMASKICKRPDGSEFVQHWSWEVDHIKPIALGGDQWDEDNLQLLCHTCHAKKTKKEAPLFARERKIPSSQKRLP